MLRSAVLPPAQGKAADRKSGGPRCSLQSEIWAGRSCAPAPAESQIANFRLKMKGALFLSNLKFSI